MPGFCCQQPWDTIRHFKLSRQNRAREGGPLKLGTKPAAMPLCLGFASSPFSVRNAQTLIFRGKEKKKSV